MKTILIIGGGHLGTYLAAQFRSANRLVIAFNGRIADCTKKYLDNLQPDVVVNAAAKTDLGWCQVNAAEAWDSNVTQPLELLRACKRAMLPPVLIHISSGCVWDGPYRAFDIPFGPDDPPNPPSFYGWTKASADRLLLHERDGYPLAILRPRQVFSSLNNPRNTLTKLLGYKRLIDTPNTMTSAYAIYRAICRIISTTDGCRAYGRIMGVYDSGVTSPFQVGMMMHEAGMRSAPELIDKTSLDQNLQPRRVDVVMHDPFFETFVGANSVTQEMLTAILGLRSELSKIKSTPSLITAA